MNPILFILVAPLASLALARARVITSARVDRARDGRGRRGGRGRLRYGRNAALRHLLHDLVQGQVEKVRTLARIDQDLAHTAVDLLHGFEVQPVARDLWST